MIFSNNDAKAGGGDGYALPLIAITVVDQRRHAPIFIFKFITRSS